MPSISELILKNRTNTQGSLRWMGSKIQTLRNELVRDPTRQRNVLRKGNFYFYLYSAKWDKVLPYWDMFPFVLILDVYRDSVLGLNFHYLPLKYRLMFMDKLMDFSVTEYRDEATRLSVTYNFLASTRRFKEFQPCIKKYLFSHIKSKMIFVHPPEWSTAVMLPVQQFQKARSQEVWDDSLRSIR